jgi:hypothetical protein
VTSPVDLVAADRRRAFVVHDRVKLLGESALLKRRDPETRPRDRREAVMLRELQRVAP